jgi:hypothetical protein
MRASGGFVFMPNERTREADERGRTIVSGTDARQGEIILRTPLRKAIFIAGLAGFVILVVVSAWLAS